MVTDINGRVDLMCLFVRSCTQAYLVVRIVVDALPLQQQLSMRLKIPAPLLMATGYRPIKMQAPRILQPISTLLFLNTHSIYTLPNRTSCLVPIYMLILTTTCHIPIILNTYCRLQFSEPSLSPDDCIAHSKPAHRGHIRQNAESES